MSCTAFTPLNNAPVFPTQGPDAGARFSDSDEFILILKRASARRERPLRAARDKTSVHECIFEFSLSDHRQNYSTHKAANGGIAWLRAHNLHAVVFFNRANAAGLLWRPASLCEDQPVCVGNAPQ
jgi:hypothetical protein